MPRFKKMTGQKRAEYLARKQRNVRSLTSDPGQVLSYDDVSAKQAKRINKRLNTRRDRRLGALGYEDVKEFRQGLEKSGKPHDRFVHNRRKYVERQQYLNSPAWATDPLTRRDAVRDARSAARLEYGPVRRQLRDELRGSGRQQHNIDLGFDLYTKKLADLQARSQQLYGAATNQVQSAAMQARTADAGQQAQLQQQAQADAAQRGATATEGPEAAQASRARQMLNNSWAALIAQQGVGEGSRLLDQERIGERSRIQAHAQELGHARDLRTKQRELKSDRGKFLNDYLAKAREGERRYALERKAFGLDVAKAKSDAAADRASLKAARAKERADRREADRQYQLDLKKYGADRADEMYDRRHPNAGRSPSSSNRPERSYGPGGRFTRAELRNNREEYEQAQAAVRVAKKPVNAGNAEKFINALVAEKGIPRPIATAAVNGLVYGGTSKKNAHKVRHRYGIKVKIHRRPKGIHNPGDIGDIISDVLG